MARLPTRFDLSAPGSLRSGRQIATYDTSAIGRGIQQLGAGLGDLASSLVNEQQDAKQQNNVVDISRAESNWLQQRLSVQNQAENDTDYSTFDKRYTPQLEDARTKSADLIRDPKMRERWLANAQKDVVVANDWLLGKAQDKQKNAEIAALNDANLANYNIVVDPNTPEDIKDKARTDMQASIDQAEKHGLLTPEQASEKRWKLVHGSYDEELILGTQAKKYNIPDADALTKAVVSVESEGRTNAESSKGASGLMQVMPETAQGIAKELGDANFPSDPEKQKEYLKNPDVSLLYGKKYLNDMLAKYNGDEEAALIAYNGGPGRADAWLKAGRDDSVIPQETRDYYKKVLGKVTPGASDFTPDQIASSRTYLQAHTDKDASHINGLQDGFAVRLSQLLQGAPPAIRDKLGVFSGARTYERQAELWSDALKKYGSVEEARRHVAPPGKSNHNFGLAADLSYEGKSLKDAPPDVVNWLHSNAGKYGLKFPLGNENWHIEDGSTRNGLIKSYPPVWNKASPEARLQAQKILEQQQREKNVEDRSIVDAATQNAPAAIQNTGQYTGQTPTQQQFVNAYGPQDGINRFQEYQTAVDTSHQVYDMRTMTGADIQKMVEDAKPTSTGDNAALESKRYEVLAKAAATTIAAREADPVTYIRNAYPAVNQAWDNASKNGTYQEAITATMAAQQQLGIRNQAVLPKDVAAIATGRFKDVNLPENDRISAITGLVFATKDPAQRNAIFNQLVDAGLPDATQGAVEAFARGDEGAGRRLFQAAIIDPSKLPGVDAAKMSLIDTTVQSKLMDKGQIGNAYYGLSDGTADNFERAMRDAKLIKNSVLLRMTNGEDMDAAIDNTAKDLYGDLQVVTGNQNVNTELLLPKDADPAPIVEGLAAKLPEVENTVKSILDKVPMPKLEPNNGNEAVLKAVRENYVKGVISQGKFKNVPGGYIFIDPYHGSAVSDEKGKPIIFQPADVKPEVKQQKIMQLDGSQPVTQTQEESDIANFGKLGAEMLKQQREDAKKQGQ